MKTAVKTFQKRLKSAQKESKMTKSVKNDQKQWENENCGETLQKHFKSAQKVSKMTRNVKNDQKQRENENRCENLPKSLKIHTKSV